MILAKAGSPEPLAGTPGNDLLTRHGHPEPFFGRNQMVEILIGDQPGVGPIGDGYNSSLNLVW
jgi:hypothetical protein